jgi:hypothetical protein
MPKQNVQFRQSCLVYGGNFWRSDETRRRGVELGALRVTRRWPFEL